MPRPTDPTQPWLALPWFALVTGQMRGKCETRLIQRKLGLEATMFLGEFEANTKGCQERIVVFASSHPPVVRNAPGFTDFDDAIEVDLRDPEPIRLHVWLVACRGERGRICEPAEKENLARYDAHSDVIYATYFYESSFAGVRIEKFSITDVHDKPWARQIEADPTKAQECQLPSGSEFEPNALNIYYIGAGIGNGLACRPLDGDSTDAGQLRKTGFVIVPMGDGPEVLSHELGHILLDRADHPFNEDPTNIMFGDGSFTRCNFDLEQAFTIHEVQSYRLYRGKPETFRKSTAPAAPLCDGLNECPSAMARLYPFACPQETLRVVTDWVRCLHCSPKLPPKIGPMENASLQIPIIEMMLGGHLRIQDRAMVDDDVNRKAGMLAGRFQQLSRDDVAKFYWTRMLEETQMRAAMALQRIEQPCTARAEAIAALKWALGELKKPDIEPHRLPDTVREAAVNALRVKQELAGNCAAP